MKVQSVRVACAGMLLAIGFGGWTRAWALQAGRKEFTYHQERSTEGDPRVHGGPVPYRGRYGEPPRSKRTSIISQVVAVRAARDFLNRIGSKPGGDAPAVQNTSAGSRRRLRISFAGVGSVTVDGKDGSICSFGNDGPGAADGKTPRFQNADSATPYVERLAKKIGLPKRAKLISISLRGPRQGVRNWSRHGVIFASFEFVYSGLVVPAGMMTLSLDPQDGSLRFMNAHWREYVIETSIPRLTTAKAKAIGDRIAARDQMGHEPWNGAQKRLKPARPVLEYMVRRPGGSPRPLPDGKPVHVRLVWDCRYGYDGVLVDAVTGAVQETYMAKAM